VEDCSSQGSASRSLCLSIFLCISHDDEICLLGVPQSPSKEQSWAAFKQITIDHFTIQPLSMLVLYEIMVRSFS